MAELNALSIAADILRRMGRNIRCRDFVNLDHFRDAMKYGSLLKGWTNSVDGKSMNYQTSHKRMRMHVSETFLIVTLYSPSFEEGRRPFFICEIQDGYLVRAETVPTAWACVRAKPERLEHVLNYLIPAIGEDLFYHIVDLTTFELLTLAAVGGAQRKLDRRLVMANIGDKDLLLEPRDGRHLDSLIKRFLPLDVRESRSTCTINREGDITSLRIEYKDT